MTPIKTRWMGTQLAPTLTITEGMPACNVRLVTLPDLAEHPQFDEN